MMRQRIGLAVAAFVCVTGTLMAQKPKSNKEAEAFNAIIQAQTPDAQIAAVENLLTKYADTEFKAIALQIATNAARQKNDVEQVIIYGERTLEADPKNYDVMILMANAIASRTKKFDLDKTEKLNKAEQYAKTALPLVKSAQKLNPNVTDAQWEVAKKDYEADDHQALGLIYAAQEKYPEAIAELKTGIDLGSNETTTLKARLAQVYNQASKYDDAIATADQILNDASAQDAFKAFAKQQKDIATSAKGKSGGK